MEKTLVIKGGLMSLNEYVNKCRGNKFGGGAAKKQEDWVVSHYIWSCLQGVKFEGQVQMDFTWYCKDRRQDPDNICFAKKFILDALVKCGTIPNDNWRYIKGFTDTFEVDSENPRIEVLIREV